MKYLIPLYLKNLSLGAAALLHIPVAAHHMLRSATLSTVLFSTCQPPLHRSRFLQSCDVPPPPASSTPPAVPSTQDTEEAPPKVYSENWSGAGRFADEDPLPLSFWFLGPSPRRAILPGLVATFVAPAVNLWGSGSFLLSLNPEAARKQRFDTFYPVSTLPGYPYNQGYLDYAPGFQRYYDEQNRFEFRYPATYVQDQTVYLRNQDLQYTQRTMDPSLSGAPQRPPRRLSSGPVVAFGPAGGTGEENLSVVVGGLEPGFTLRCV